MCAIGITIITSTSTITISMFAITIAITAITTTSANVGAAAIPRQPAASFVLHSAKGGAVETGCSDLYDVMY